MAAVKIIDESVVDVGDSGHDGVGTGLAQARLGVRVSDRHADEAGGLGRFDTGERVFDDERSHRAVDTGPRSQDAEAELVPHGIGFAARRILGADDVGNEIFYPHALEREGYFVAQCAGHDGHCPLRGATPHRVDRPVEHDEPHLGAAHIKRALGGGEGFDLRVGGKSPRVGQHRPQGADVVEPKITLHVRLVAEGDAKWPEHIAKGLTVDLLVIHQNPVEIENRRGKHGAATLSTATAPQNGWAHPVTSRGRPAPGAAFAPSQTAPFGRVRLSPPFTFGSLDLVGTRSAASELLADSLRHARVLIVDDDPLQCSHLAKIVSEWQAEPFTAQQLSDALRLHKEAHPDLVLLDVMMPHVDGYKLAQMFKRASPFVPIILLTALEDIDSKRRGLSAGADEFLSKPVNALELQIRMSSMIRIKRLADELERVNKNLAELATIDPLTQVANRRVVEQRLAHEFQRERRYKHPLACILIDIDHFKAVNDNYGHPVGDKVLVEVAAAIRESIRTTDLVARFGGEEFIVIAPETTTTAAEMVAERIRRAITEKTTAKMDQGLPAVTASLGVACTEVSVLNETELVAKADAALYRAKHEGRNRVVVAGK